MPKNTKNRKNAGFPQPDLLARGQLVDREDQINKFKEVLGKISRQGLVSSNLFEWYGSPGIGKTTLVTLLTQVADARSAPWILVDFKSAKDKGKHYRFDPVSLIEDMTADLAKKVDIDFQPLYEQIKNYRNLSLPAAGIVSAYYAMDQDARLFKRPLWLEELRKVVIAFITLINGLPGQLDSREVRPVVLFFDETEHADIELVDWIEEWIINPLIQIKHCVVVWTARRPWRWKRPEIRRRLTSEALDVFDPTMVKAQITSSSHQHDLTAQLFKNVHVITGGHPFANRVVINELDLLARQGQTVTPETFSDFEARFLREIFNQFIDGYAFKELESDDLKIAAKLIALVRLFDTTMLRDVLQTCEKDRFGSWSQEEFGNLLLQLKKTQLLVWEKGYALDPGLRHIIQKYFMVSEPRTYIEANQTALAVYDNWLGRPVDNRSLFVVEELYHSAALSQVGEAADLERILEKRLGEYPVWIKDEQALENALERLEGEIANDKELEQYTFSNAELVKQVQTFREARLSLSRTKK